MHRRASLVAALTAAMLVQAPFADAKTPAKAAPAAAADLTATTPPEAVGFDGQRLKALDAYMAKVVADGRVAGMTTLLARHGKVVEFNTYGKASIASGQPMPKDEIFRIYSMTKPLTGVAMMILFEQGKWRLDDPVTRYVPEFKNLKVMVSADKDGNITGVEDMKRPPTMREIMSHTAGFGYGLGDKHPVDKLYRKDQVLGSTGLHQMIERTAKIPLMYQPGTSWSYSSAVDIQGYIVEKLTGQTLGQFMQANVFAPLKMKDTAFYTGSAKANRLAAVYVGEVVNDKPTGKIVEADDLFGNKMPDYSKPPAMESGGGGLVSTTMDYARFCQMMLNKGELDGVRILSPASVELMGANVIPHNVLVSNNGTGVAQFNEAVGFGLDFMVVNDARRAGHMEGDKTISWGGAAGTWFWIDPTNDVLFVGMIQRMGGTGGDDLGTMARTLTYQALLHPEK
ncbi:MAG TPA: serine hydrolase domain-containing protein [Phenylobacterium sp.]|nr:serine hydrolase domain-containing protein [Phenylobacterium sp.]